MASHRLALLLISAALGSAGLTASGAQQPVETYRAHLTALNSGKIGSHAEGDATFRVVGDTLEVHIRMTGVPADIEHWEHFHGFPDGKAARCVAATGDVNKDGFIDLIETEPSSGTTMVPFNDKPEDMVIPTHTYPHASAKGSFEYTKSIPLAQLSRTFGRTYPGGRIDLDKRVIYVHGVPGTSKLPGSVKSLGPIPSHVTLPIACGAIVRVANRG